MRISNLLSIGLVALVGACSSSDSTTTSVASNSGDSSTSAAGLTIVADTASLGQNVVAGSTVAANVHVVQGTTPASGVLVTWSVSMGGGTISTTTSLTDAAGLATVNWTMGDTVATNNLVATISGASVGLNTTTVAGPVSTLLKVSPDSQALVAGAALTITARPVDRFGNGVAGVPITWSASGGTLSAAATTSGLNGNATTNFVTDATPGTYLVTGSVAGKASVTFTVVGF